MPLLDPLAWLLGKMFTARAQVDDPSAPRYLDDNELETPALALATAVATVLDSPQRRAALLAGGDVLAGRYNWTSVARQVVEVYETVTAGAHATVGEDDSSAGLLSRLMSRG